MALIGKYMNEAKEWSYAFFRIAFGVLFACHGAQKLGLIGTGGMATGLMLVVGIGEMLIGLGLLFGVLTRVAAAGGIVIMIGALVKAHFPKSLIPIQSGELAWLYLIAFIFILTYGAGKASLEKLVLKKELV